MNMDTRTIITLSAPALALLAVVSGALFFLTREGTASSELDAVPVVAGIQITNTEPDLVVPEGSTLYRNEKYNFKFAYPSELEVAETDEGGGSYTIVFTDKEKTKGFQIFITPHVGRFITPERIKTDIPSGKVESPVEIIIDGARGTIFYSEHPALGETREAWFLQGDFLYEVTTYKELDQWLSEIMATWKFLSREEQNIIIFQQ